MNNKISAFLLNNWYFLLMLIATFSYCLGIDTYYETMAGKQYLAIFSALLAVAYLLLRLRNQEISLKWALSGSGLQHALTKLFYGISLSACIFGVFNYYSFNKDNLTKVGDYYDLVYYYLNSKYSDELGYTLIYDALLIADAEGDQHFAGIQTYRELEAYKHVSRENAFAHQAEIKARFTPERWQTFVQEVQFFAKQPISSSWEYFFNDHGYNGTPGWTMMGKLFSRWISIENAKWFTSVDMILIILTFVLIIRSFSWEAGIFGILFYTSTLSGQWPVLGWALLRFDWLAALVLAMVAWQRQRPALTGGLIAYAGMMRVFPSIFFFPFAVAIGHHYWKQRKFASEHLRFIAGAGMVTLILMGSALISMGPQGILEAKEKIALHAGPDSYSSHRVGLGVTLTYHGETSREEMNFNGGTLGKGEQIRERLPYLRLLGLLSLAFIAFIMLKERGQPHLYMPLCLMTVFILTTPQVNYYNMRLLLVLWHLIAFKNLRSTVGLVLLFGIDAFAQHADTTLRYYSSSSASIGLTAYFIFIIGDHLARIYFKSRFAPRSMPVAISIFSGAMLALFAALAAPQFHYRHAETRSVERMSVDQAQLATPKAEGYHWRGEGTIVMPNSGISVQLADTTHASYFSISLDNNDDYLLRFYAEGESTPSAEQRVTSRGIRMRGLAVSEIPVPSEAIQTGYNRIDVIPVNGDSHYSIGHLTFRD